MMLLRKLGIGAGMFAAAVALASNGLGPDGPRDLKPPKGAKADSPSSPDPAPPPHAVTTDNGKLMFEFLADAKQAADVPILMKVVMTNSGKKPCRYWTCDGVNPPFNRQVKCHDESGKVRDVVLWSGGIGPSGVHKELDPGRSLVIPVVLEPLPKGMYSLNLDGGTFKFTVVDDPEFVQNRLRDLLRRNGNSETITRHAMSVHFTRPLRELCLQDLTSADDERALAALYLLTGRGELPKGAVGVLVRAIDKQLKNDKPDIWVLQSLASLGGQIGSDEALDAVIKLVWDDKSQGFGCTGLGLFKQERAATELKKLLKHKNEFVRWAAAATLADRKDPAAIETLIDVARNGVGSIRWAACNSLVNYPNDPRAEDAIRSCLDVRGEVGDTARAALKRLQEARDAQKNNP